MRLISKMKEELGPMRKLDLSWNRFNHEQFTQMGVLIEATEIEELGVDYCAAYVIGRDSPVAELLEGLARDKSLKKLSLVANRVDFRAALNALKHFQSDGCYQGISGMADEDAEGCSVYSFTNPGSKYVLDLSRPYHRSLLRILYKTAERCKMPLDKSTLGSSSLRRDASRSLPYLSYLCRSSPSSIRRTMKTMFPTVPSDSQSRYLAMLCLPTLADFYTCYPRMEALLTFNAQNPTGHYSLDLSNSCEFAVAQRLLLLDRWEAVCNKRRQRVDTSAMGNKSQLRNESHRGRPLHLRGIGLGEAEEMSWKVAREEGRSWIAQASAWPQEELQRLRNRLGFVTSFPFLQPENTRYVLNLKYNDQRLCCALLVDLAIKEKFGNIREFTCKYVCAPEDRQVDFRKKLAQTYGFINTTFNDADIAWWTGLNEVGEDVLDLLEFFISRYNHVNEAFHHIDGGVREGEGGNTTSNGELTLRLGGCRNSASERPPCGRFRGPNEKERIGAVFRYLDPGGEGNVSLQEWQILDQLWKEPLGTTTATTSPGASPKGKAGRRRRPRAMTRLGTQKGEDDAERTNGDGRRDDGIRPNDLQLGRTPSRIMPRGGDGQKLVGRKFLDLEEYEDVEDSPLDVEDSQEEGGRLRPRMSQVTAAALLSKVKEQGSSDVVHPEVLKLQKRLKEELEQELRAEEEDAQVSREELEAKVSFLQVHLEAQGLLKPKDADDTWWEDAGGTRWKKLNLYLMALAEMSGDSVAAGEFARRALSEKPSESSESSWSPRHAKEMLSPSMRRVGARAAAEGGTQVRLTWTWGW
eukprot:g22630.t1